MFRRQFRMIEIEFFFENDVAYNIHDTMMYILRLREYDEDSHVSETAYNICVYEINQAKFRHYKPEYLPHLFTGVNIPFGEWLLTFGIEENIEHWIADDPLADDNTIHTFDMTDSEFENEHEECIEDDEEMDLVIGHNIMTELMHEQDDSGLFIELDLESIESFDTVTDYEL